MTQVQQVQSLFKRRYGKLKNILPKGFSFLEFVPYNSSKKLGKLFEEPVALSFEGGITFAGKGNKVSDINPAVSGAVESMEVEPYEMLLRSVLPFSSIVQASEEGEAAFFNSTKHVVRNNLKSMQKFLEAVCWYGQSTEGLGTVSYASQTYRGVSLTNGGGVINGITFTAGVNTTSNYILLAPGQFAAGVWVGTRGTPILQVTSAGVIVGSGKVLAVNSRFGYIQVDFTPTAATAEGSHKLVWPGMQDSKEMIGVQKILSNTATLMNIDASKHELWKGNVVDLAQKLFTWQKLIEGIEEAVDLGLEEDLDLFVNNKTWGKLLEKQMDLRKYDSSYKPVEMMNGAQKITFHANNGVVRVQPSRHVKEGDAFGLVKGNWDRFGATDITFSVRGKDDLIFPLEQQTGWAITSYALECISCDAPGHQIYFKNINHESAS